MGGAVAVSTDWEGKHADMVFHSDDDIEEHIVEVMDEGDDDEDSDEDEEIDDDDDDDDDDIDDEDAEIIDAEEGSWGDVSAHLAAAR